jgi:hypothetical protein
MKTLYIILLGALCFPVVGRSQATQISYFMENASMRTFLNPALHPNQGYLAFPALGNFYVNMNTNTLNLDHFTFYKDGNYLFFMNENISADEFLRNISINNYLDLEVNAGLLSAGWYAGEGFWNVDLSLRMFAGVNIPKSFFKLAKEGFGVEKKKVFDLSNVDVSTTIFTELGVGYSLTFLDGAIKAGFRGKFLTGNENFDFKVRSLSLETGEEDWIVHSNSQIQMSGQMLKAKYDEDKIFNEIAYNKFILPPSGYGLGFDIGVEYDLSHLSDFFKGTPADILSRMKVSLALIDVGYIRWSKYSAAIRSQGIGRIDPNNLSFDFNDNNNSLKDHLEGILSSLKKGIEFREDMTPPHSSITSLYSKLNAGIIYEVWKDKLSIGLLSSTAFLPYHTQTELTLSANYQPLKWLGIAAGHSFIHGRFKTFCFALHIAPVLGLNLFIASDYLIPHVNPDFIPTTTKVANVQLGITIPIGEKR